MKKLSLLALSLVLVATAACGKPATDTTQGAPGSTGSANKFDASKDITVISREDGSGTRGAFVELFGILEADANGKKIDKTTLDADITSSTSVMMTSVANNPYAIGYISLGSLNDTVKALQIDGVQATAENVKNGTYKISRPFHIATKDTVSPLAQDFIDFILSSDGQAVVSSSGYVSASEAPAYSGAKPTGKIVVAGSSSVTPVMEKLREAYLTVNPSAEIEIQQSDSTTGMNSAIEGICDIGMASRNLKDSEVSAGLKATVIAMDGIAVIVNHNNTTDALTAEQVKAIYTGETTTWAEAAVR